MKNKTLLIVAVLAASLLTQDIFAQEMLRKRDREQIHKDLALTIEQQEKIDELRLSHHKEMIDLKANLEHKKLEMAELKNKGNYSREDFIFKTNEIISARNKIAIARANHQMDVYQLLNESQKKQWNKFSSKDFQMGDKRIMRKMKNFCVD